MNKKLQEYVKKIAKREAKAQLQQIEDNFLSLEYFQPKPATEEALAAAFKQMVEREDKLWWNCWEGFEEMIPEMLEEHEERVVVAKDAKALMAKTFHKDILNGLGKYLGIIK